MKFLKKNQERRGCGLVAAYNAAQWAGIPISYEKVSEAARAWCGFRNSGMKTAKMTQLFRSLNVPTSRLKKGTLLNVPLNALWDGHAVVFGYCDKDKGSGHAILVTPDFKILNPDPKYKKWTDLFNAICTGQVTYNAWIVGKP
jgi:hypothetical protein